MAAQPIPTTIAELLATATQATGNIDKHRQAMAQVAAQVKAGLVQPAATETPK